ncbi:MAG TPA: hypothetical protein VN426_01135 [Syntrophomonadaceae bacterium]|nr:hypothetical protein [Syntrophomonadaceae bacterium]
MSTVLIYCLSILAVLLAAVILAPIQYCLLGEYAQGFDFRGRIRWAGGFFSFEMIRSDRKVHLSLGLMGIRKNISPGAGKSTKTEKPSPKKGREKSFGNIMAFINRQLFTALKNLLGKIIRALHLNMNLSGTYGFEDPSLTGMVMGLIATLPGIGGSIDLHPDFTQSIVDIRGSIRGWFVPLQILAIGVVFIFKKPVRALWWPKIKIRRKQKEVVQYV